MSTREGGGVHVRVTRLEVHADVIDRVKKLLAGAPSRVSIHRAMIGIQEPEGSKEKVDYDGVARSGRTLAQVMIEHEYGTDVLPERSFLRAWFDANVDRLHAGMTTAMRAEFAGDTDAVRRWAHDTAEEWRKWIASGGDFVGLMPSTIARKTAAGLAEPETPLVATFQFADAFRAVLDGVPA